MTRRLSLLTVTAATAALALSGCGSSSSTAESSTAAGGSSSSESSSASSAGSESSSAGASAESGSYTMAQVQEHNSKESCWAAIEGEVYDLTEWISNHPGGPDKIEGLCGTDGTSKFEGQHEGAEKPNARLATFKIGKLSG